jgi:hypothetical protein
MKKISTMTILEIKSEMKKIESKCLIENKWLYKNRRHTGLLNELTRRAGLNIK